MNQNNIVNLSDYRKKQEKEKKKNIPPQHIQGFEVDGYYIYPELGVMIHCMLITNNSHTSTDQSNFIMEDQFGNLFFVPTDDPESILGWHALTKEVYEKTVEKVKPDPEPPRVG